MKRIFVVPGRPRAKQSTRFANGHTYTDSAVAAYENWVKLCYLDKYRDCPLMLGPIEANVDYIRRWPKMTAKQRDAHGGWCTTTPDVEQVTKAIFDALNKLAYNDDRQICLCTVSKKFGDVEQVTVTLEEISW